MTTDVRHNLTCFYGRRYQLKMGLGRGLTMTFCKYYGTFICSWINWFAIYTVHIHRNANFLGITTPF